MSSLRFYLRVFASLAALVGVSSSACRSPNPGFHDNQPTDETDLQTTAIKDTSSTELRTDAPTESTTESSSTNQASTQPTTEESSSSSSTSSAQSSSSSSTSSTQSSSAPDPAIVIAKAYCGRGSIACYPMISVDGDRFEDYGPSKRHMPASGLSTVDVNQKNYPFPRVVDGGPQGKYKTQESYPIPDNGAMGFDLWLRPTYTESKNWTAIAIDKYISLLRVSSGKLRCGFQGSSLSKITESEFTATKGTLHHIACAFDGSNKLMWVDGKLLDSSNTALPSDWPSSTPYIFGWDSVAENPFDGHIGAIRIWDDIQALEHNIAQLFP